MFKLNDDKTEYIIVGSKHNLSNIPESLHTIRVGNQDIAASPSVKNIGVYIDSSLSMEKQALYICKLCYISIRDIGRIRKYLTEDATKKLVIAFVTSKLDTNNALLFDVSQKLKDKLQMVQNTAARLIARKKKYDSITETKIELHWLPVDQRIEYKIYLLTFKSIHKLGPSYLQDLTLPYVCNREGLRSEKKKLLEEDRTKLATGDRAFAKAAPVLWKELPQRLRDCDKLKDFKEQLKTFLFDKAYKKKATSN